MPTDDTVDRGVEWMLAFQSGDESAFDRLVEEYSKPVYSLLSRFLGQVAGREDMVQEVFLRVLRARDRYRPTARFSTWLYRIAYNLCVNERERRALREGSTESLAELDASEGSAAGLSTSDEPWRGMEREDVIRAVQAAIAKLPERQRMALLLARFEEQSHAEIGAVLDVSERAVKSMIHRARENLRASLAPLLAEELA